MARLGSAGARGSTAKTLKLNPRRHKRHRGAQIREMLPKPSGCLLIRSAWIHFANSAFSSERAQVRCGGGVKNSGPHLNNERDVLIFATKFELSQCECLAQLVQPS